MVYAYITSEMESFNYTLYKVDHFVLTKEDYLRLKDSLTSMDVILIKEAKLLGNTLPQVVAELEDLHVRGIHYTLLENIYLTDSNITAVSIISYLNNLSLGQSKIGRPESKSPVEFDTLYRMYLDGEIKEAITLSGLSRATFYRKLAKYEKENGFPKRRNSSALAYGKTLQSFNIDTNTLNEYPLLKL